MYRNSKNQFTPQSIRRGIISILLLAALAAGCSPSPGLPEAAVPVSHGGSVLARPNQPLLQTTPEPIVMIDHTNDAGGYRLYYPASWQATQTGTNLGFNMPAGQVQGEAYVRFMELVDVSDLPSESTSRIEVVPYTYGPAFKQDILNASNQVIGRSYHIFQNSRWYRISVLPGSQSVLPENMAQHLLELDVMFHNMQIFTETITQKVAGLSGIYTETSIEAFLEGTPMAGLAPFFVQKGYENDVDPRLVVGLAYAESHLGEGGGGDSMLRHGPSLAFITPDGVQGAGVLMSPVRPMQGNFCGDFNAWGTMGAETCKNFSSWEEAIDYATRHVAGQGKTSLGSFADGSEDSWCKENCEAWLGDLDSAYEAMSGDSQTNNLSWDKVPQDYGMAPKDTEPKDEGDIEHPVEKPEPEIVTLSTPLNGASITNGTYITSSWNKAANAEKYMFEVWGGDYGSTVFSPCGWQSDKSCSLGKLGKGTYSWRVKARDAAGAETDFSETWTFSITDKTTGPTSTPKPTSVSPTKTPAPPSPTKTPAPTKDPGSAIVPGIPQLSSPGNGVTLSSASTDKLYLEWHASTNAEYYLVEVWGGPYSKATTLCDWFVQNELKCDFGYNKYPGEKIYWHVKAKSSDYTRSSWSETWWFTWDTPAPSVP